MGSFIETAVEHIPDRAKDVVMCVAKLHVGGLTIGGIKCAFDCVAKRLVLLKAHDDRRAPPRGTSLMQKLSQDKVRGQWRFIPRISKKLKIHYKFALTLGN